MKGTLMDRDFADKSDYKVINPSPACYRYTCDAKTGECLKTEEIGGTKEEWALIKEEEATNWLTQLTSWVNNNSALYWLVIFLIVVAIIVTD